MVKLIEVGFDGSGHHEKMPSYQGQQRMNVRVLPRNEWQHTTEYERERNWLGQYSDVYLALFEIPYIEIPEDQENTVMLANGSIVDMGDYPHLRTYGEKHFDVRLRRGNVYDIHVMVITPEGIRGSDHQSRFIAERRGQVPYNSTLEEMKLAAIGSLGLTPEEAKGLKAEVVYQPEERMSVIPADNILAVAAKIGGGLLTLDYDPLQIAPPSLNFVYLKPNGSRTGIWTQLPRHSGRRIQVYVSKDLTNDPSSLSLPILRQLVGR